jgi:hypothetical protein
MYEERGRGGLSFWGFMMWLFLFITVPYLTIFIFMMAILNEKKE